MLQKINALLWEGDISNDLELGPIVRQHRMKLLNNGWRGTLYKKIHTRILTELYLAPMQFVPGMRILELGCGEALELFEIVNLGGYGYGIDIRPDRVSLVNKCAHYLEMDIKAYQSDACSLNFKSSSFDVVMATSFFEHVYDDKSALSEAVRVLRPGGFLIIRDGNILDPLHLFEILIRRPISTYGKIGGISWIRNKGKLLKSVPIGNYFGKDEDWKTIYWWGKTLAGNKDISINVLSTVITYLWFRSFKISKVMRPFFGGIFLVAQKQ